LSRIYAGVDRVGTADSREIQDALARIDDRLSHLPGHRNLIPGASGAVPWAKNTIEYSRLSSPIARDNAHSSDDDGGDDDEVKLSASRVLGERGCTHDQNRRISMSDSASQPASESPAFFGVGVRRVVSVFDSGDPWFGGGFVAQVLRLSGWRSGDVGRRGAPPGYAHR